MEGLELISFQIISGTGLARSLYIEAIDAALEGRIEEAESLIKEGEEAALEGHKAHLELLAKSAEENVDVNLLLMHAEDQLMCAETFQILAEKFVKLAQSK